MIASGSAAGTYVPERMPAYRRTSTAYRPAANTGQNITLSPERLRLRLFSAAAQTVTTGRRRYFRLPANWPWTDVITSAIHRLQTLPNPG